MFDKSTRYDNEIIEMYTLKWIQSYDINKFVNNHIKKMCK